MLQNFTWPNVPTYSPDVVHSLAVLSDDPVIRKFPQSCDSTSTLTTAASCASHDITHSGQFPGCLSKSNNWHLVKQYRYMYIRLLLTWIFFLYQILNLFSAWNWTLNLPEELRHWLMGNFWWFLGCSIILHFAQAQAVQILASVLPGFEPVPVTWHGTKLSCTHRMPCTTPLSYLAIHQIYGLTWINK